MTNLTGLIISNDSTLRSDLARVLSQIEEVSLVSPSIPLRAVEEIESMVESKRPAVCFLDMTDLPAATGLTSRILRLSPNTYIVGIGPRGESGHLVPAMRAGVRDYIARPLTVGETRTALEAVPQCCDIQAQAAKFPLFSFLPAKPGVGASTVCVHTATALAARPNTRIALLDLDVYSGSLEFLLNLGSGFDLRDVLEYADRLDSSVWERMIAKAGGLDVLRAGFPDPDRPVLPQPTASLLAYARENYTSVCVDLPGMGDPASFEALRMSHTILLVTTPEVASVYMAGRMLEALERHGLSERVRVILNRQEASAPLSRANVESALGRPVMAALPNHYALMQQALHRGEGVITKGPIARNFQNLALELTGAPEKSKSQRLLGLLDRFFLPHSAQANQ